MNTRENIRDMLMENKIVAILRKVDHEKLYKTACALLHGGISCIEVTFDQSGDLEETAKAVGFLSEAFQERLCVGCGTVMTEEQVQIAADAGARYIISPDFHPSVVAKTRAAGMVSIPGAMTPSEIASAYGAGADIVKVFPAGVLGAEYVKAVRAPISHIPLMAVGGINVDNIAAFAKAGISCFGIGSNIVRKDLLEAEDYASIEVLARSYLKQLQ